ncbi:MAG: HAD-IA family hydrolase [Chitinophagaceae bacterium]|nr:HAD-IA family hydrolase [Chitinophagaceae bacterium]
MIKLIIFDLDGVLVDAKNIHYNTLNEALGNKYKISWEEHLNKYDGLKTNEKLKLLTVSKGLPPSSYDEIWAKKQKLTIEELKSVKINETLKHTIKELVNQNYKLAVCSNSIRKTILTVLSKLDIIEHFDYIMSNEDVNNSKPHPEMYWKTISYFGFLPEETLIIEDSPFGLLAANRSKSNIMRVESPSDVTINNINKHINTLKMENNPKWKNDKLNVLIPMAGAGSRFEKAGYTFPKPLIDVNGKPMIQVVVDNLNLDANFIYIIQKSHRQKYNLDTLLNLITPNCSIIEVDGITEGAACTALMAKELINNDKPLFFANSDQYVEWNSSEFLYKMQETNFDGGIVTFKSTHPKWSFVKLNENNFASMVAEKNPISDLATVGYYFWKNGSDFVKYAEQMIDNNIRVNNEFYVCPVFNEAINDGKKIITFNASKMWGLGTPEDLDLFLKNKS